MSDKKLYQLPALTGAGAGDLVYVSKADGSADGAASFASLTPVLGGVLAGAFAPASHGHALADIAGAGALSTYAAIAPSADVQGLLGAASDAAIRSQLGLALGADVQAYSPALGVYAAISPSTDVQTLLGAADYPAFRSSLGLAIGADVQGYSARLADLAGASWAQGDLAYFNGSNLTRLAAGTSGQFLKTQGAAANPVWDTVSGGGGSAKPFINFRPIDNEPPTSNFASLDTRNGHPVLNFDTTTQETAIFSSVMPTGYGGGNLIVSVYTAAATATSGTIGWLVAIERIDASSLDIDADSFTSDQTITATTVSGVAGQILKLQVTITAGSATDNLAAGEAFRLRLKRDVSNDTAAGDAQILRVTVEEA